MELLRLLLHLPPAASTVADRIDGLHALVIGTTILVALYVFGSAAWFTYRYRRRGEAPLTAREAVPRRHEIILIAVVLTTFVTWWVIGYRQYVDLRRTPPNAETVFVDAKQWMWKFAYPDGRTANDVLTIPLGRPVRLVMTSRDVIHSFFVPAFRLKTDVIPGRTTTMWFEAKTLGSFPIWCAEYCGVDHSTMRGEVLVVTPEEYGRLKEQPFFARPSPKVALGPMPAPSPDTELIALGRATAEKRQCTACHTFDGQRHIGPTFQGLFGSERVFEDGRRAIADDAYLTRSMMEPLADVVRGFAPVMPTFKGTLTNVEAGALVAFIASLESHPEPSGISLPHLTVTPKGPPGSPTEEPPSASEALPGPPAGARSEP